MRRGRAAPKISEGGVAASEFLRMRRFFNGPTTLHVVRQPVRIVLVRRVHVFPASHPISTTALHTQRHSLLLARHSGGTVTLLVINDDLGCVFDFRCPATIRQPYPAALVQGSAHLLHRDLWIFFSATDPYVRQRIPSRSGTESCASSRRHNCVPRSGQSRSRSWPRETCVPRSSA
jgi:hypothetical protein